jgi:hypothetical protein
MEMIEIVASVEGGRVVAADRASGLSAEAYFKATRPYHEAAHVVVGSALGYGVGYLTLDVTEARRISGNPLFLGLGTTDCGAAPPEHRAIIAAAGIVWEAYFGAPGLRPGGPAALAVCIANAHGGDWDSLLRFAPTEAQQREAIRQARDLLTKLEGYVWLLGKALAAKGRLDGPEIAALINEETEERRRAQPGSVELHAARGGMS